MKKNFALILSACVFILTNSTAQTPYWRLSTSKKLNYSHSSTIEFKDPLLVSNNNFRIESEKYFFDKSVFMGLGFGFDFKEKGRLELGWSQDAAGHELNYSIYTTPNEYGYYTLRSGETSSQTFHRFYVKRYKSLSKQGRTNIIYGVQLGVLGGSYSYSSEPEKLEEKTDLKDGGSIGVKTSDYANKGRNLFLTMGLEHDVMFKKNYLFSISIEGNLAVTNHIFHQQDISILVVDENDQEYRDHYSYKSKGSGVVFTISRRMGLKFLKNRE